MTVADLFDPRQVVFSKAPNPSDLLQYHHEANSERSAANETLSVLTYNVALLDAKIFGFIDYSASPHLAERRDKLPQIVLEQNHDIIMLQEVWVDEDVARFKDKAKEAGYHVHTGPRDEYNDGCVTLIRKSIMKDESVLTEGGVDYAQRDGLEYFPGPELNAVLFFFPLNTPPSAPSMFTIPT